MPNQNGLTESHSRRGRLAVDQHLRGMARQLAALEAADIPAVRELLRGLATDTNLASGVTAIPARDGPIPGTWLVPRDADPRHRVVYCHGLSFLAGDFATYGGFVSRLAAAACASILLVEYRLAPENNFPAAHDDCLAAFLWAREHGPGGPTHAKCALMGDSCGASLALASALASSRAQTPARAVILFSPFADLAVTGESWIRNQGRDPLLTADLARACAAIYAPGLVPGDVRLSPLVDDLSGLPPLQIHASMSDPAYDDASRLATLADQAGVPSELHVWSELPHNWFLFHGELPEARHSIGLAGSFLRRM